MDGCERRSVVSTSAELEIGKRCTPQLVRHGERAGLYAGCPVLGSGLEQGRHLPFLALVCVQVRTALLTGVGAGGMVPLTAASLLHSIPADVGEPGHLGLVAAAEGVGRGAGPFRTARLTVGVRSP